MHRLPHPAHGPRTRAGGTVGGPTQVRQRTGRAVTTPESHADSDGRPGAWGKLRSAAAPGPPRPEQYPARHERCKDSARRSSGRAIEAEAREGGRHPGVRSEPRRPKLPSRPLWVRPSRRRAKVARRPRVQGSPRCGGRAERPPGPPLRASKPECISLGPRPASGSGAAPWAGCMERRRHALVRLEVLPHPVVRCLAPRAERRAASCSATPATSNTHKRLPSGLPVKPMGDGSSCLMSGPRF
jgi:hypothetical protein